MVTSAAYWKLFIAFGAGFPKRNGFRFFFFFEKEANSFFFVIITDFVAVFFALYWTNLKNKKCYYKSTNIGVFTLSAILQPKMS